MFLAITDVIFQSKPRHSSPGIGKYECHRIHWQKYQVLFNEAAPRRCWKKTFSFLQNPTRTVQFQVDPSQTALLTFISSDKENFGWDVGSILLIWTLVNDHFVTRIFYKFNLINMFENSVNSFTKSWYRLDVFHASTEGSIKSASIFEWFSFRLLLKSLRVYILKQFFNLWKAVKYLPRY